MVRSSVQKFQDSDSDAQKAIDQRIIGLSSRSGVHIALSIFLVQTGDGVGFIRIGDPQASERLWQ